MEPTSLPANPTPAECSRVAAELYRSAPTGRRLLMKYRPFICPFDLLITVVPQGARVLDVGCGGGLLLTLLAAAGRIRAGVGFDTNTTMIALARGVAKQAGLPLTFEQRAVEDGWPDGEFDVISVIDVMHHIPPRHQEVFLDQLIHRLPPGGRLIYKDMARRPVWRALANRLHDLVMARQWIHYLPIDRVEAKADEHGLHEIECTDRAMLWYGHELRVYQRPDHSAQ